MPHISYTDFFKRLLDHPSIHLDLNTDALTQITINGNHVLFEGKILACPLIYTGPLDELFDCCFGKLPYRSLRFEWKYEEKESFQKYPVVAYPQAKDFVRIIEYKKLPVQNVRGTTYEVEYSLPYKKGTNYEPYYPLLTGDSQEDYKRYSDMAKKVPNLFVCGRLGDFKYYNMDQALERALEVLERVLESDNGQ